MSDSQDFKTVKAPAADSSRPASASSAHMSFSAFTQQTTTPIGRFLKHPGWLSSMVFVALLIAGLAHGTAFAGTAGYRAVYIGILVGTVAAVINWRWETRSAGATLITVGLGLLFSGVAALPATTRFGIIPTGYGLLEALRAVITSWKDLLTLGSPVPETSNTLMMPYTMGLITASFAMLLALRSRHFIMALVPVFFLLVVGILWGTTDAILAPVIGFAGAFVVLEIVVRTLHYREQSATEQAVKLLGERHYGRTRSVGSAIILILVGTVASSGAYLVAREWDPTSRYVARDYYEPALDMREYPSPATFFRAWNTREAETELFTVKGGMSGARLRLATLDHYDGTIFRVTNGQGQIGDYAFRKVFSRFSADEPQSAMDVMHMDVTVGLYSGHWLPGGEQMRSVEFDGPQRELLQESLFFSKSLSTLLTTIPIKEGDSYRVECVAPKGASDAKLEGARIANIPIPEDEFVPKEITLVAAQLTDGEAAGLPQIRAIQQKLSGNGFYSDGLDGNSRPGHRSDRLTQFLTADYMVGDDDQYAPAMVLMLRSLGIPARLAMGFVHEGDSMSYTIHGHDVRMWVEVPFEGIGWVAFDPTPPKDQTLRTEVPKPKPQTRPQVLQPPDPPVDPVELQADEVPEPDDGQEDEQPSFAWVRVVLLGSSILALLVLPILILAALKALRAVRRRRKGNAELRAVGAWDELLDRSIDLGVEVRRHQVRITQAHVIEQGIGSLTPGALSTPAFRRSDEPLSAMERLADEVDAAVYGPTELSNADAQKIWGTMTQLLGEARAQVGWKRRLRALYTARTLLGRWTRPTPQKYPRSGRLDATPSTLTNAGKDNGNG